MAIRWTDTTPPEFLPPLSGQPPGVHVRIAATVDEQVLAHLRSAPVEQGGLLIGHAWADPASGAVNRVAVTDCVPAEVADGTAWSLRMDAAVWSAASARLRARDNNDAGTDAASLRIVGWYHSHPGLTAFFSETDRQTQRSFFNHAWSVGWVIDPFLGDEAFFLGADCQPIGREPSGAEPSEAEPSEAEPSGAEPVGRTPSGD